MSQDDSNPEDLSARSRRAMLSRAEERELARALRGSATLRASHTVGADLDRSTAVRPGDEDLILAAADRALERVLGAAPVPRALARTAESRGLPRTAEVRASSRGHARKVAAALVAAAMISASGMAAAWWAGVTVIPWLPTREDAPAAPAPEVRHRAHAAKAKAKPEAPEPAPAETALAEPASAAEPEAPVLQAEPLAQRAVPRPAKTVDPGAPELFSRANAARRAGDFTRARRAYSDLIAKYPGSDEARLSELSLGKLLLASGEAAQAEREFRHYLSAGHEPLAEEALVNQAESFRAMNRAGDERKAWQKLLADHPNSVYAARARARLSALAREP